MDEDNVANPELLGFLKEWYDYAKEHNSKVASTYKRAYESMKACPVTLDHPSQAIQLSGLGPKLCERLTQRLEQYCLENNKPIPQVPRKNARKRNAPDADADADSDDVQAPAPPPNPKRPRKTKEYVPTYRSGAYGLLIALYEAGEEMLTKEQLIEVAQPHSDASFTAPSDTTKYHTAWGSMKTLIEKNLVYGRGRPKRFWLTEVGDEVAKATVEAMDPDSANRILRGSNTRDGSAGVLGEPSSRAPAERAFAKATAATKRLQENWPPRRLGGGALRVTDDEEDYRRIAARANASRQKSRESSRSASDIVAQRNRLQALYSERPAEYGKEPRPAPRGKPPPSFIEIDNLTDSSPPPPQPSALRTLGKSNPNIQPLPSVPHTTSLNKRPTPPPVTREVSVLGSQPQQPGPPTYIQSRQPAPPTFQPFVPDVLRAGTFTVRLLLDNREVRAKGDRDYISKTLADAGVTPIIRALQVGDAMWIAHENGGREREVVLDYIVERKRLDDLVSSIKDGRFHDQKFRLKKSGVKNVAYIIEDFSMGNIDGPTQESIETAISSTQVVNGFFVKKTNKLDDTIRYLVRMTKMLEDLYKVQDLSLIPESLIDSRSYQALLTHLSTTFPEKNFYITYTIFSSLVSKSGALTLRDVYLKMLMCVRGVSVEKALEIQRSYATPRELVNAYERCDGDSEKKDLIMKACSGAVGRKKIVAVLSSKISEVWAGVTFEDDGR